MLRTTMIAAALFLLPLTACLIAGDRSEFRVYVQKPKDTTCPKLDRVAEDATLLFTGQDVLRMDWQHQSFLLSESATAKLLTNAAEFEDDTKDSVVPRGLFPESEGHAFAIAVNGKVLSSGLVAGIVTLQNPPNCPLLYPDLPMLDHGRLVLAVGLPKKEMELREDFFKVFIEEGPSSCFSPILPDDVRNCFGK